MRLKKTEKERRRLINQLIGDRRIGWLHIEPKIFGSLKRNIELFALLKKEPIHVFLSPSP